ncbi:MAG: alpha/beta fold hydrolase [Limnohabitans sp.]
MSASFESLVCQHLLPDGRRLAFTDIGPAEATDILVCLPGLLETRQTFDPVLQARPAGLRCISIDHCGRGQSDPLPDDRGYSMARYLADLQDFLEQHIPASSRLHLLGTSMGGILAFYLVAAQRPPVHSLLLNDIGLELHWTALMGLASQMRSATPLMSPALLAQSLGVSPGVLADVQKPAHFDLPYRRGLKGMDFSSQLAAYTGPIRLLRGQASVVCLPAQVRHLKKLHPGAQVLEVAGASHPVPFDAAACDFLLAGLCSGAQRQDAAAAPGPAGPSFWRWLQGKFSQRT